MERQGIVYKVGATERYNGYSLLTGVNGVITERWYYVGGYVIHKQKYTNGEEKGLRQIYFHLSDLLQESGHYEDGQKEGNWQQFHKNGQVASNLTFKRGCYAGYGERYHENGKNTTDRRCGIVV